MKKLSGSAISRQQVFVLSDGSFVVQWEDRRVQNLLSGHYREYDHAREFGHHITDYELLQLKAAGRVEHFNRRYVWLYALPEKGRFNRNSATSSDRLRVYYLTTELPRSQVDNANAALRALGLFGLPDAPDGKLSAQGHQADVILVRADGHKFATLEEAQTAQERLQATDSQDFHEFIGEVGIAYAMIDPKHPSPQTLIRMTDTIPSLDELIASQRETLEGDVLVLVGNADERQAFTELLETMHLGVSLATDARMALRLLEDQPHDLLLMDLHLSDMHGWELISKMKEIDHLRELPIVIITDEPDLKLTVAKVHYVMRPVSIARLRYSVWKIFKERHVPKPE